MKAFQFLFLIIPVLTSCNDDKKIIVDEVFADSLITHYTEPAAIRLNREEAEFWRKRIDPNNPGFVNETKYAGAMAGRFLLSGDIDDLKISDSVLQKTDEIYNHKEAGPVASLASHAISQHRFKEADSLLAVAKTIGLKTFE